jgi:hypothetical protein
MPQELQKFGIPPALARDFAEHARRRGEVQGEREYPEQGSPALALLVTPGVWGPIDDEMLTEFYQRGAIFRCGKCSRGATVVYHNLYGSHRHVPAEKLLKALEKLNELSN